MNSNKYESRFFRQSDPKSDKFIFSLPSTWWSRFYEYHWAGMFVEPNDTVLDAACGISHPFKFFLAGACQEVHACDLDKRILSPTAILRDIEADFGKEAVDNFPQHYFRQIQFANTDIAKLPYNNEKFEKVFCISVLEHLPPEAMFSALTEFKRILKSTGLIILTFDYPTINLETFRTVVANAGLSFYEHTVFTLPEDAVCSDLYGRLYCYRAILKKTI
ncbi:MAG: class I SAM-dependent methyltransferase [Desulfitobacterium hafniense]|nr:class I SAM-dependent methyltransferase [Desulfitobacterium hafniense]